MQDSENNVKKIFEIINKSSNILLLTHQKPDGDALGAVLSFADYFKSQNLKHTIFSSTEVGESFSFLEGMDEIVFDINILKKDIFDVVLILDSGDLYYTGVEKEVLGFTTKPIIINIDHHETNENFGDINYINSKASSTTQILFDLFKKNNIKITKNIANCFLTGILTDTHIFTNGGTTLESIDRASELLNYGASFSKIMTSITKNNTINSLRMWGEILSRMKKNEDYDLAIVVIKKDDFINYNLGSEAVDGLPNFLNNLSGVKASLVLKETENGKIKGSFRTTLPNLDISRIAKFLGGGGHRKSAGFTITGRLVWEDGNWVIL